MTARTNQTAENALYLRLTKQQKKQRSINATFSDQLLKGLICSITNVYALILVINMYITCKRKKRPFKGVYLFWSIKSSKSILLLNTAYSKRSSMV